MASLNLGKHAIEALMIVFSVLVALGINKTVEVWQTRKQTETARTAIRKELERNEELVRWMVNKHEKVLKHITDIESGKNDSLKARLLSGKHFDFWVLTENETIAPEFASNTAWETARVTGLISEFAYSEIEDLTRIYAQQEIIFRGTLSGIIDLFFDRETSDLKNFDQTLVQFKVRFTELIAQEKSLVAMYEDLNSE